MIDSITSETGASTDRRKPRRKKLSLADPTKLDRLPPHSIDAEQGVLGCVMLSPNDCLGECIEKFKSGAEVLYDLRHQEIFKVLLAMWEKKEAIDLITISQRLKDNNQLENIGGLAYLSSLPDAVPSAANLAYYTDIVVEKYVLRKMIQTCTDVVARAYEHEGEVDKLLDAVAHDINALASSNEKKQAAGIKSLVKEVVAEIQRKVESNGAITGIPTGFTDIDKAIDGLVPGELGMIAGRSGDGKSALAVNIMENIAVGSKIPAGMIELEMTAKQMVSRVMFSNAKVNSRQIGERDFPKLVASTGRISNAPIHIEDESGLNGLQVKAKIRRMAQQHGIKVAIVDYIGLVTKADPRKNNIDHINEVLGGLKALAKELNIAIIALMQLNRNIEREKGRKPMKSDLRDGGEQDPDWIGILYCKDQDAESDGVCPMNFCLVKNRNGDTNDIPLTFFKQYTRFESAAKFAPADVE